MKRRGERIKLAGGRKRVRGRDENGGNSEDRREDEEENIGRGKRDRENEREKEESNRREDLEGSLLEWYNE